MANLFSRGWWKMLQVTFSAAITGWTHKVLQEDAKCHSICFDSRWWWLMVWSNNPCGMWFEQSVMFCNLEQTQEELFQRWESLQFGEATDTIDSYGLILKTMGLKCYGTKKVKSYNFSKTLPTKFYHLLLGIQNLREAFESSKCVMTKENWTNS